MVVEDDYAICQMMVGVLEDVGYQTKRFANGAQALAAAELSTPDAVVLDLMMPFMNGWSFLEAFRRIPDCAQVPVIVTSAWPGVVKSQLPTANAYLAKPFDIAVLLETVQALVADQGGLQPVS
jgi:CheY-like chemotaxis protein